MKESGGFSCYAPSVHPLSSKHPAFWRAIAGLIVGTALSAVFLWMFDSSGIAWPFPVLALFAAPLFGVLATAGAIVGQSDALETVLPLLFYPVLCALVGFFVGERQRFPIVVAEIVLAAIIVALWAFGTFLLSQM